MASTATTAGANEQNMPFIKNLASSDKKTRTAALSTLRTFLSFPSSSSSPRTPLENLKLWKGLFYSLWMCDRPVPQQNLCAELAALADALPGDGAVCPWLAAFWATLAGAWTSIDVLRLEKFLLLVRRVFAKALEWASSRSAPAGGGSGGGNKNNRGKGKGKGKWSAQERRGALLELFREWPFEASGDLAKMPVGLRLHVLDIWVDELEKAGFLGEQGEEEDEEDEGSLDAEDEEFLQKLRELVETQLKSPSKPVRARAKESLADERLPWNKGQASEDDVESEEEDDWGGFKD